MSYLEETTISLGALLFQLPYELLELIAEWFTRSEAVPVLSVNSAFQELFASSVWRRLDNLPKSYWYTDKYNTQELRLDALCIYGRFVRRVNASWNLRIPDNLEDVFVCITHLWIPIDKLVRVIEGTRDEWFDSLCFLSIIVQDKSHYKNNSDTFDKVVIWLYKLMRKEAGLRAIEWDVDDVCVLTTHVNKAFTMLASSRDSSSRLTLKLRGKLDVSNKKQAALTGSISEWDTYTRVYGSNSYWIECTSDIFIRTFMNIATSVKSQRCLTFPILSKLSLDFCGNKWENEGLQVDFGSHFPAVRELKLSDGCYECIEPGAQIFLPAFSHPWPSVCKLEMNGYFSFEEIVPQLSVFSNLAVLVMDNKSSYGGSSLEKINLSKLGRTLHKLTKLSIKYRSKAYIFSQQQRRIYRRSLLHQSAFNQLRSFHINCMHLESSALQEIISAPVLADVCLENIQFLYHSFDPQYDSDSDGDSDTLDTEDYANGDGDVGIGSGYKNTAGITLETASFVNSLSPMRNSTVRSIGLHQVAHVTPINRILVLKAFVECFERLAVCETTGISDIDIDIIRSDIPDVKFISLD